MLVTHLLIADKFKRPEMTRNSWRADYSDYPDACDRVPVSFYSGKNKLKGYIYAPDNNDKGLIVFGHGLWGGHSKYMSLILAMTRRGFKVFAFDNTGCMESEGKDCHGLVQSALDMDAALTYIENDDSLSSMLRFLLGHSWGAFAVTAVFNFNHEANAAASLSGFYCSIPMLDEQAYTLLGPFSYYFRPFIFANNCLAFGNNANISAIDGINRTDTPIFISHGISDDTIHFDGASIISRKGDISNPGTRYHIFDGEYDSEHNSFLFSADAVIYQREIDESLKELEDIYDGKVPDELIVDFYSKIDRIRASEENTELINMLDEFFSENINS